MRGHREKREKKRRQVYKLKLSISAIFLGVLTGNKSLTRKATKQTNGQPTKTKLVTQRTNWQET